jgi:hypothetical protein
MRFGVTLVLIVALLASCTLIYRSQDVILDRSETIVGTNRVFRFGVDVVP